MTVSKTARSKVVHGSRRKVGHTVVGTGGRRYYVNKNPSGIGTSRRRARRHR